MAREVPQLMQSLETTSLPSLPHVLLRVLEACNRNETSLKVIADIINKDSALSSKVLGASSSALYGMQNRITTFEQKLIMLGLDMVKTIAISSSIYQVFSNLNSSKEFDLKSYWRRSLTSATVAKLIAQEIAYPYPEEAYLTGLLLDVGQLVLWSNYPKQYAKLCDVGDDRQLIQREKKDIGNNHCEVGAWLVDSWHLSSFLSDAVLYHHEPAQRVADSHLLIRIAHAANSLSMDNPGEQERLAEAAVLLEIVPHVALRIMDKARGQVAQVAETLEIDIDKGADVAEDSGKPERDNFQQKRMELALEVRDIALVDGVALGVTTAPPTLDGILLAIQRSLYVLFGIHKAVFFLHDRQSGLLKGKSLAWQQDLINELTLPLKKGSGIVADFLLSKSAGSSFSARDEGVLTVLDDQISRLLEEEGFYCQPMVIQDTVVGAMLFGHAKDKLPQVEKQRKLISMFSQQAAQTLIAWYASDLPVQSSEPEPLAVSRAKARQIVHEANNPLSIIKNYIKLLGMKLPEEDPAQEDLLIIKGEIDRVRKIIQQVSEEAEAFASQLVELNVNDVIGDLNKIFLSTQYAEHQVATQIQLDPSLPNIVTDKDKLKQVLINLIKNAVEAMQDGGQLLISTRGPIIQDGNEYIEISLKDNGPGIPEHIAMDLFKPVTSTKGKGHSGLGLSIVKNLLDEIKGGISCQSNKLSGTVFRIVLPVTRVFQ